VSLAKHGVFNNTQQTYAMMAYGHLCLMTLVTHKRKMVNGFRYYRALESVSIASALSTALTIYPCQIRVHQR